MLTSTLVSLRIRDEERKDNDEGKEWHFEDERELLDRKCADQCRTGEGIGGEGS
jgi:hypothetical protein